MIRNLQAASLIALAAALGACQPQSATPESAPGAADTAAPAPAVQEDPATPAVQAATPEASASDPRAFAGRFVAAGTSLELRGDGRFELRDAGVVVDGTWTAEEGGTLILLDPDSKAEPDRLLSVTSIDEIHPLGAEGMPAPDGAALRREGSQ